MMPSDSRTASIRPAGLDYAVPVPCFRCYIASCEGCAPPTLPPSLPRQEDRSASPPLQQYNPGKTICQEHARAETADGSGAFPNLAWKWGRLSTLFSNRMRMPAPSE